MPGTRHIPTSTIRSILFLCVCPLVATNYSVGQTLSEIGDAGMLPASAQEATSTAITTITGTIADGSDIDIFKITIDDPDNFTATTEGTGGNLDDSRLFLFDADGRGVYFNDDASDVTLRSTLPLHGDTLGPIVPGDYYLAISGYPMAPTDIDDVLIFLDPDSGEVDFDDVAPPNPGTTEPVGSWATTTSFSTGTYEIGVTGVNGTLSATFADVDVHLDHGHAVVTWSTASEFGTSRFVVETRTAGTAGFVDRESLAARGAGFRYMLRVEDLPPGPADIRIRADSYDGTSSLSQIVAVEVPVSAGYILSEVYPNPFRDSAEFTITVNRPQRVQVHVHNLLGQRVLTVLDEHLQENAVHRVDFSGSDLPAGIYMVSVRGERFSETRVATRLD